MSLSRDVKSKIHLASIADLKAIQVHDFFYEQRKTKPLELGFVDLHEPRKYALDDNWRDIIVEGALNLIFLNTERKLSLWKSTCQLSKLEMPYNLFSWSISETLDRVDTADGFYIDFVAANFKSDDLDRIKLQIELTQILEIFNTIATQFMDRKSFTDLIPTLEEYLNRDSIQEDLNVQYDYAMMEYKSLKKRYNRNLLGPPRKLKEELNPKLERLQELNMEIDAIIPIQDRYKVNWYQTETFFKKFKNARYLKVTQDKIDAALDGLALEEDCFDFKITMYNLQRIIYADAFDDLTEKFDIDYEVADNENGILQAKLAKAIEDLKVYKEQVVFFKEAVEKTREIIRLEALEEQLRNERVSEPPVPEVKGKGKGKGKETPKKK